MPIPDHGSFLLHWFDRATHAWVTTYSLVAIPPLRPKTGKAKEHQRNRDIFVWIMFSASLGATALCYLNRPGVGSNYLLRIVATFALYRGVDMFITFFRGKRRCQATAFSGSGLT